MKFGRADQSLEITVHSGQAAERTQTCSAVAQQINAFLGSPQGCQDFGIQFRFEVHCEVNGESDWWPLKDLRPEHAMAQLWSAQSASIVQNFEPLAAVAWLHGHTTAGGGVTEEAA